MAITSTQQTQIVNLYVGMFNKAPSAATLTSLASSFEGYTGTDEARLYSLAESLSTSSDYTTMMAGKVTSAAIALQVVTNAGLSTSEITDSSKLAYHVYNWAVNTSNDGVASHTIFAAYSQFINTQTHLATEAIWQDAYNKAANKAEVATYYATQNSNADATNILASVTADSTTVTAAKTTVDGTANPGQTFMLTTGVDAGTEFTGGAGNDTYTALIDSTNSAANQTFTVLDNLDGGAGNDTLNLNVITTTAGALPNVTVANIETMNVRAGDDLGVVGVNDTINDTNAGNDNETASVNHDVSGYTGLTTLNVTKAVDVSMTAATTTDVNVSGATGAIEIVNGQNISITHATADQSITVGSKVVGGAATGNAQTAGDVTGTITVTDTNQGSGNILVDSGTDVTVTASSATASGVITVGAAEEATGTVTVTQNTNVTSDAVAAGNIAVTGGTTITVNANSTNVASLGDTAANVTAGTITVTGGNTTTNVNVTQNHTATDYDSVTTAGTYETATITFGALDAGEAVVVGESIDADGAPDGNVGAELTFVASVDMTAEEVAAAFANLTSADTQAAGGIVENGYFLGSLDAGWTSGAADGATVTFTATTTGNKTDLEVETNNDTQTEVAQGDGANNADFTVVNTDGTADSSTTAVDVTAATAGTVTIDDNTTASITDVTVDGYGTLNIGLGGALTKLENLSLANSAGTATIDTAAGITDLNLTVNAVNNAVDISTNSTTLDTLNIATTGAASSFALTAAQLTDLTVSGDQTLTLTGSTLTAIETVVVTGTAGLVIAGSNEDDTITSVDTSGTTGSVTITIDGDTSTYTGGAGVDTVTLDGSTAADKAIDLGAGDDTLIFASAITGSTATMSGGDGNKDTLSMTAARAAALDASAQTFYTNFERLTINDGAAGETIDLANLGFTDYVTTTGNASASFATVGLTGAEAIAATDTITFVYNGIEYTATITNATSNATLQADLNDAVDADGNEITDDVVTIAAAGSNDLTLTVANAGDSLVGGTYTDVAGDSSTHTATNTNITLDKMDSNGTLVLAGTGAVTVQVTDADEAANTTDVLNIIANVAGTDYNYGVVTVADVETVNITSNDTLEDDDSNGTVTTAESAVEEVTLTLTAADATTVNVYGAADVDLTLTGTTAVTLVDASTMTGALTVTASGTTATTIKGGSAGDSLTAATGVVDTLYGYAGDDILTSGTKTIMYGGEGADTFIASFVTAQTVDDYAKIMDIASGDIIKMTDADGDSIAAFTKLADANVPDPIGNPNLSSYADAAIKQNAVDSAAVWFQYNNNTFIVMEGTGASDTYNDAQDNIVMISGLVDLDTASFNATHGTIEIA